MLVPLAIATGVMSLGIDGPSDDEVFRRAVLLGRYDLLFDRRSEAESREILTRLRHWCTEASSLDDVVRRLELGFRISIACPWELIRERQAWAAGLPASSSYFANFSSEEPTLPVFADPSKEKLREEQMGFEDEARNRDIRADYSFYYITDHMNVAEMLWSWDETRILVRSTFVHGLRPHDSIFVVRPRPKDVDSFQIMTKRIDMH